jgi:hypothetical protein
MRHKSAVFCPNVSVSTIETRAARNTSMLVRPKGKTCATSRSGNTSKVVRFSTGLACEACGSGEFHREMPKIPQPSEERSCWEVRVPKATMSTL